MTTDALERDLKTLVEPQEADERLRLAIRARLDEQLHVRPRRRVRMRLAFGVGSPLGCGGRGGALRADRDRRVQRAIAR